MQCTSPRLVPATLCHFPPLQPAVEKHGRLRLLLLPCSSVEGYGDWWRRSGLGLHLTRSRCTHPLPGSSTSIEATPICKYTVDATDKTACSKTPAPAASVSRPFAASLPRSLDPYHRDRSRRRLLRFTQIPLELEAALPLIRARTTSSRTQRRVLRG